MHVTNVSAQNVQPIEVRICFLKGEFRYLACETSVEEVLNLFHNVQRKRKRVTFCDDAFYIRNIGRDGHPTKV